MHKNLLLGSFILGIFALVLEVVRSYSDSCLANQIFLDVPICLFVSSLLSILLPISIIGFCIRNNNLIFLQWKRFTVYYVFAYLLIYLLSPADGGFLQPIYKETVCLTALILYPVISLGVILFARRKSN
jgi:hypothetical protein